MQRQDVETSLHRTKLTCNDSDSGCAQATGFSSCQWELVPATRPTGLHCLSLAVFTSDSCELQFNRPLRNVCTVCIIKKCSLGVQSWGSAIDLICNQTFVYPVWLVANFWHSTGSSELLFLYFFFFFFALWMFTCVMSDYFLFCDTCHLCLFVFSRPGHYNSSGNTRLSHLLSVICLRSSSYNNDCFSTSFAG